LGRPLNQITGGQTNDAHKRVKFEKHVSQKGTFIAEKHYAFRHQSNREHKTYLQNSAE